MNIKNAKFKHICKGRHNVLLTDCLVYYRNIYFSFLIEIVGDNAALYYFVLECTQTNAQVVILVLNNKLVITLK